MIDPSWQPVIQNFIALLTLIVGAYIAIRQQEMKKEGKERTEKIDAVHTIVNSAKTKSDDDLKSVREELNALKGAMVQRDKTDAAASNRAAGAAEQRDRDASGPV